MILRDKNGKKIGEVTEQTGVKMIRDAQGRKLGEYDPSQNLTRDANGNKVGEGDLLAGLLKKE